MSKGTIVINGKTYALPVINYRAIIKLEDLGFETNKVSEKLFKSYAALVALTADVSIEEAAVLIEQHCENGGALADFSPILEHVIASGFFTKMAGQNTPQQTGSGKN